MTSPSFADLERLIRGTYTNVPPAVPGLCNVCTAPTSGPQYSLCLPCEHRANSGYPLARGVVPLSWAPMAPVNGYSAQGYLDLRQYKEPDYDELQIARLRTLLYLAIAKHAECVLPEYRTRSFAIAHVPSTSGERDGPHPVAERFVTMFSPDAPRVVPEYVGRVGGDRNGRRAFNPANWHIEAEQLGDAGRVLIIDDTWVSGGHAQSLAAAFEGKGIAARTVVLGRAIDPNRTDHGSFLRAHDPQPFDSDVCPVHRVRHER